jgi:ubiquinone/menaquinone biosynthesis C-methylase UbiE
MNERILDIGCGMRKTSGAVGIDILKNSQADIVWDLNAHPWPVEDNSFDRIICNQILEHCDDVVKVLEEIHRIGKAGGLVCIDVPHFSHPEAFRDPTHKHYFSYYTFDYFTGDPMYPVYSDIRFQVCERRFKAVSGINRFVSSRVEPRLYEERFSRIFPCYGLSFILKILK